MAATTLGAWASDLTYKVNLKIVNANHAIEGVSLDTPYQVPESDIITTFCAAYPQFNTTEYDITIDDITTYSSTYSMIVETGKIKIEAPSIEESVFDKVLVTVKPKGESTAVSGWNGNEITLSITIYHEQHNPNSTWESNDDIHFHNCDNTNGRCELENKLESAAHTYDSDPTLPSYYTCKVCDYVNNSRKPAHAHNYSTQWYNITTDPDATAAIAACDATKHWHKCTNNIGTCEASESRKDMAAHSFDDDAHDAKYYTCSVCSYEDGTRNTAHSTHTYAWKYDENQHWKECTAAGVCEALIDPGNPKMTHIYGSTGDERFTCTICDYVNLARKAAIEANEANNNNPAWSWTYDIPFAFNATNVTNDRKLNALSANNKQQGYTVCLPYEITLPSTVEVYTLTASKDNQVGFVKTATNKLAPLTPYLIIPSISGQLLNAPDATIVETSQALVDANDVTSAAVSGQQQYTLKGSISYKSGDVAASETTKSYYILQGENKWGKLTGGDYLNVDNPACILPLRAYLVTDGTAPARLFSIFDEATGISREIVVDADSTPVIYDLQGRKVSNPQRGGLYIINGKKMIMK